MQDAAVEDAQGYCQATVPCHTNHSSGHAARRTARSEPASQSPAVHLQEVNIEQIGSTHREASDSAVHSEVLTPHDQFSVHHNHPRPTQGLTTLLCHWPYSCSRRMRQVIQPHSPCWTSICFVKVGSLQSPVDELSLRDHYNGRHAHLPDHPDQT